MTKSNELLFEGFQMTKEWFQKIMEENFGQRPEVLKLTPLGKEAIGYMSLIRRIHLKWPVQDEKLPQSVIMKCSQTCSVQLNAPQQCANGAAASAAMQNSMGDQKENENHEKQMLVVQKSFHNMELQFLDMFSKVKNLTVRAPLLYGGGDYDSKTPCILMKDYGDCQLVDLIDGFNEKQLYAIVDQIVEFQSFSLTNEDWLKIEPTEEYYEMHDGFGMQLGMIAEKLMEEAKESLGDVIMVFLDNTYKKDPFWFREPFTKYIKGNRNAVLVHGDLWAPQILWKDGKIKAIVDWQMPHKGSPAEDLIHLLTTCASVETRRSLEAPLIDYYYQKLTEKTAEKGGKVPFTKEEFLTEFRDSMVHGCALTLFANAFWSNSDVLKPDGVADPKRITESFSRCRAFLEDTIAAQGW